MNSNVSQSNSVCRLLILLPFACEWIWEGGEERWSVDHKVFCWPLLVSSHRLRSDISCCYFGMLCCQAVVASYISAAEVK